MMSVEFSYFWTPFHLVRVFTQPPLPASPTCPHIYPLTPLPPQRGRHKWMVPLTKGGRFCTGSSRFWMIFFSMIYVIMSYFWLVHDHVLCRSLQWIQTGWWLVITTLSQFALIVSSVGPEAFYAIEMKLEMKGNLGLGNVAYLRLWAVHCSRAERPLFLFRQQGFVYLAPSLLAKKGNTAIEQVTNVSELRI